MNLDDNVYRVRGLDPTSDYPTFYITLDSDLANKLQGLSVQEKQQSAIDSIEGMYLEDMFSDIRFRRDTFLLTNITVAGQATGLDLRDTHANEYEYHTHNMDTHSEVVEIIAAFEKWVDLGFTVLRMEGEYA